PDEYISQRGTDILDACRRVVDILDGRARTPLKLEVPSILAGECIYPSDIITAGRGMVLGLASAAGSIQSHAAIIARTMGIPAVVHLGDQFLREGELRPSILDADNGRLIMDPGKVQIQEAQRRIVSAAMHKKRLSMLSDKPCVTLDGTSIGLWANCSTPEDIQLAV
ncbi:phosphoenolpyruvate-protein phosphotransferase, partial [gut metagenome]